MYIQDEIVYLHTSKLTFQQMIRPYIINSNYSCCVDMTRLMVVFFMFPLNINVKKRKFSCETWNLSDVFLR